LIPTLPLALRNRLAATIVEAVGDAHARRTLTALVAEPDAWLDGEQRELAPLLAARARRASEALAMLPVDDARDLDAALDAAARLYDAGLYFEVHEWLEPHWMMASGEEREALQGVIQAAVGWQHLANGNIAGARSLLHEAARRLSGARIGGRPFDAFACATAHAATQLPSATPPAFPDREESL